MFLVALSMFTAKLRTALIHLNPISPGGTWDTGTPGYRGIGTTGHWDNRTPEGEGAGAHLLRVVSFFKQVRIWPEIDWLCFQ